MKYLFSIPALIVSFWTKSKERFGYTLGRTLLEAEAQFAKELGIEKVDRVRIHIVDSIEHPFSSLFKWIGQFSGKVATNPIGITLGYTILLSEKCAYDSRLISHELVHVHQYERMGGHVQFLMQYIYECLWYGYSNSPLEKEAESLAQDLIEPIDKRNRVL